MKIFGYIFRILGLILSIYGIVQALRFPMSLNYILCLYFGLIFALLGIFIVDENKLKEDQ